jgi:hypothetical protein
MPVLGLQALALGDDLLVCLVQPQIFSPSLAPVQETSATAKELGFVSLEFLWTTNRKAIVSYWATDSRRTWEVNLGFGLWAFPPTTASPNFQIVSHLSPMSGGSSDTTSFGN